MPATAPGYDPSKPPKPFGPGDGALAATNEGSWTDGWYPFVSWLIGIATFIGCWIYCIKEYGFLLGVGLGWLPSAIVAIIVAFLWPLILFALLAAAIFIFKS